MSSLAWLDFDEAERQLAQRIMSALHAAQPPRNKPSALHGDQSYVAAHADHQVTQARGLCPGKRDHQQALRP